MNHFSSDSGNKAKVPKHLESLATTVFQSLFPAINPQTTPLRSIRRVLLLDRDLSQTGDDSFVLNFRHYAITTKPVGRSKALSRLKTAEKLVNTKRTMKGGLPNLGKLQDIADFLIGGENGEGYMTDGGTSGSEVDTDAEVEVLENAPKKILSAKARAVAADEPQEGQRRPTDVDENVDRRAVKLVELGPRMTLRLMKVEEGLCQGQVMWHEHIHKTKEQIKELKERWDKRKKEKEARKKLQKENVEKKRKAQTEQEANAQDGEDLDEMDLDGSDIEYDDEFDSEGLEGDAEMQVNEHMEEAGEWEDEEREIAGE